MPFIDLSDVRRDRANVPPVPGPVPRPGASVTSVTSPRTWPWMTWINLAVLVLVVGIEGWRVLAQPAAPSPADGVALGRAFAPELCGALADGFDALASDVAASKPMSEANEHLRKVFQDKRQAAFAAKAAPAFAAIVPAGTEPADDAHRTAYVSLCRDFGRGLRKAR